MLRSPHTVPNGTATTPLLAVDLVAFGAQCRDTGAQVRAREDMYGRVIEAFDLTGLRWEECHVEDRGDGMLIVPPAEEQAALFLDPLLHHLSAVQRRRNRHQRRAGDVGRLRLRLAVHHGPVEYDGYGVISPDTMLLFRLLEARSFKVAVRASGTDLGAIVSDRLYTDAVERGRLTDPAAYRATRVTLKEVRRARAWLWLPGVLVGE